MIINTSLGINSALSVQTLIDMRNQLDRSAAPARHRQEGRHLRRSRPRSRPHRRPALAAFRHDRLSADHHRGRRAARSRQRTALTQIDTIGRSAKSTVMQSQLRARQRQPDARAAHGLHPVRPDAERAQHLAPAAAICSPAAASIGRRWTSADVIMNGDGTRAGLKQLIDERRQADRRRQRARPAACFGAHPPHRSVSTRMPSRRSASSWPAPRPRSDRRDRDRPGRLAGLADRRSRRNQSESPARPIRFTFTLPDGTSQDLTLTATTSAPPGPNQFSIGGSSAVTAANLQAALTPALGHARRHRAVGGLGGRGRQRLLQHRRRESAAAGRRPAVRHRDRADRRHRRQHRELVHRRCRHRRRARSTAVARVDQSLTLSYGMRANEEGLRIAVQSIAVFAATTVFRQRSGRARPLRRAQAARHRRARRRAGQAEGHRHPGRHRRGRTTRSPPPRTATSRPRARWSNCCRTSKARRPRRSRRKILALQTNLQATLQTTAMLLRTNLLEYI